AAGAAILLGNGRPEQAERAHVADDAAVEALLAVVLENLREQLGLLIAPRGVAHHALLFREFALEIERVLPVEGLLVGGCGRLAGDTFGGARHDWLLWLGLCIRPPGRPAE